jgi:hypothetical protein
MVLSYKVAAIVEEAEFNRRFIAPMDSVPQLLNF